MKSHAARWTMFFATLLLPALVLTGCCDDCDDTLVVVDNGPPSAPDGVYSVTGNGHVVLYWNANPEPDIAGYGIYFGEEEEGWYTRLTDVPADQTYYVVEWLIIDDQVVPLENGETYFYAIDAVDQDGLRSEDLSFEIVFDTPRPDGEYLVLEEYLGQPNLSGYDFSSLSGTAQAWDDDNPATATDVYFAFSNGVDLLIARSGVGIQDYGLIDLEDVDWAPLEGYSPTKRAEMIPGHSYIIQISDTVGGYNYAKVYVREVDHFHVTLDWAYQESKSDLGNQELSPPGGSSK